MPGPLVIAHRGASAHFPEHTRGAYRAAIEAGADGVECDVRLTADDRLVCLHDRTTTRTSDAKGAIVAKLTWDELRAHDFATWKPLSGDDRHAWERYAAEPGAGRPEDPLSLETLLDVVTEASTAGRELVTLIETKHPSGHGRRLEPAVVAALQARGLAHGDRPGLPRVRVMSFSHLALLRLRAMAPQVPLVYLIDAKAPHLWREGRLPDGIEAVGLDVRILRQRPDLVAVHHDRGHTVAVWTVDEPDDVQRCLDTGVDLIITNEPARTRAQISDTC